MLEVFQKHLESTAAPSKCAVGKWVEETLDDESKTAFDELIKKGVETTGIYRDLVASGTSLPFKSTTFRSHMKGYCVCQKK